MTRDYNDYNFVVQSRRGVIKVTHDINSMTKIFNILYDMGYRKSSGGKKPVYYLQKDDCSIVPTNIINIKLAFRDFIKTGGFINLPSNIGTSDLLEWYYRDNPIRRNGVLDYCLNDNLNEIEVI